MAEHPKRKRGGQKGNRNAVKHGYYSQAFKPAERLDFDVAAGLEGLTEEIALLRFEIKKAVSGGDIARLVPLSKTAYALDKLVRTHHKLYGGNSLKNGLKTAMRDLIIPLGGRDAAFEAIKHWCGYSLPEQNEAKPGLNEPKSAQNETKPGQNEANPITNNPQNEADLTYNEKRKTVAD